MTTDPRLWRPPAIAKADPGSLACVQVHDANKHATKATVYPWPSFTDEGRMQLVRAREIDAGPIQPDHVTTTSAELDRSFLPPTTRFGNEAGFVTWRNPCLAITVVDPELIWGGDKPLRDWSGFSKPVFNVSEELPRAKDARHIPYAWAQWGEWIGDSALVARSARVMTEALNPGRPSSVPMKLEALVGDDIESYDGADEFISLATPRARDRPDSIFIAAGDGHLGINLTIARKRDHRTHLRNTVLLEVASAEPRMIDRVVAVRDQVLRTVERGRTPRLRRKPTPSSQGFRELSDPDRPGERPGIGAHPWRVARGEWIALVVGIGIAASILPTFDLLHADDTGWALALGIVVALMGGFSFLLWPGVEMGERRATRARRLLAKAAVLPAAAALISALVRFVVEPALSTIRLPL